MGKTLHLGPGDKGGNPHELLWNPAPKGPKGGHKTWRVPLSPEGSPDATISHQSSGIWKGRARFACQNTEGGASEAPSSLRGPEVVGSSQQVATPTGAAEKRLTR